MKKTINLIAIAFLLLGCSSSDGNNEVPLSNLNFQDERLKGFWYIDKVIQADGTIEDYTHSCPTERDRVEFLHYRIQEHHYYDDCFTQIINSCSDYQNINFVVSICTDIFEGTYSYTNTNNNPTLRIDYEEVEYFGREGNNMVTAKGLIFSRD